MAQTNRRTVRSTDLKQAEANRQTQALGGLAAALFLVVVSLFLIRELHATSAIEDCLMMGRTNCDILVSLHH